MAIQIIEMVGHKVKIGLKTGKRLEGRLNYYNLSNKTVFIDDSDIFDDDDVLIEHCKFCILNSDEWKTINII